MLFRKNLSCRTLKIKVVTNNIAVGDPFVKMGFRMKCAPRPLGTLVFQEQILYFLDGENFQQKKTVNLLNIFIMSTKVIFQVFVKHYIDPRLPKSCRP